ncbi:serine/threonine-protein kinase [Streptomyces formicae]|uniref:Putative serine/threonine protein kinase n=1 Tax=Streptomyces formicae TaxID=1616117 RepID=A0A291QCI4_9ACTN|nr:serine/threonine-protein kinase [Streptomyces formicae]ATL29288.1 putative serine/threonine protein kinase [Streptomyces formicae]
MERLGPGDPQRIGAYRLLARLGAGGMGQVYLARSGRGRTVAVKLVRQELAEQEEFRNRFRQEVAAARQVGGVWTAPVLDADTEATIPWVATGYVAGPSLQSVVSHEHGPLPERSVNILAAGLANALKDIHAAGLVHRDLKPSNVLVTIDGPRVIDFGIARALETVTDGGLTRTGALIGSPGFMAPEQVRGDRITPACDVFCLGSVLAYAASGMLPFGTANSGVHALMFRIAQEEPDLEGIPESLAELIGACLHKDPAARPALDDILERTGAQDTLSEGGSTLEPWLPGSLVAQLGRHAVQLLDTEDPDDGSDTGTDPAATNGSSPDGSSPDNRNDTPPPRPASPPASAPTPAPTPTAPDDADATPPPPGRPGTAPLGHLPTMVSGQPPALTPPPSTPAPAYGYPHQPQHPSGFGPTPPYGPGGGYLPPPEPPRRSGRSTAALIVVALIVAIGAGGTVYAVMNDEGTDDAKNTDAKNSASSAPATPGPTSPSAEPSERASASSSAEEGTVPEKYLGTWNGGLKSDAGRSTRQLTLQQGEVGDTVLSVTADGPAKGGGTYHCVFQGKLESASDDRLHIGPTEVIVGEPMTSCTPGSPTVVTILGNGKLRRANTDGSGELTYDRAN